jgi:hypothetical protein
MRKVMTICLPFALVAGLLLVVALPAAAETVTITKEFTTPGESSFVVPKDVTSVTVDAVGAAGVSHSSIATGGKGAEVIGTLAVTPGETLYPEVDIGGGVAGGDTAGNGGGLSSLALCSSGPAQAALCPLGTPYANFPWYLSQVIVAAGGGGSAGGPISYSTGGAGGLLGGVGGSGSGHEARTGGQGGGAGLTSACLTGGTDLDENPSGSGGLSTPFLGVGGTGGVKQAGVSGEFAGGGGGAGYLGGCGGGAGGLNLYAGGGGGGGASFLNNHELTDYHAVLPEVTEPFSFTPAQASTGSVSLTFEDSNFPVVHINSPASDQQVGTRPTFLGTLETEADDSLDFTYKIEQINGVPKNGVPYEATGEGTAERNGEFVFGASQPMPTGRYKATVTQTLIDGANARGKYVVFEVDAEPPKVKLTAPVDGAYAKTSPAAFTGVAGTEPKDQGGVTVEVLRAAEPSGPFLTYRFGTAGPDGEFSFPFGESLPDGTYLARAVQYDNGANVGTAEATFTVDTVAPTISLATPAGTTAPGAPTFSGKAGTAPGDLPGVEVAIYSGSSAAGTPVETLSATAGPDGSFSVPATAALAAGTYTAVASQADRAGNVSDSAAATFTVSAGPSMTPPASSTGPGSSGGALPPSRIAIVGAPTAAGGKVHLTLTCSRGVGSCAVTVTGTTGEKLSGKRVEGVAAKLPKRAGRTVTVASARATLAAGARRTLTLPLDSIGKALLRQFGKLPVELRVSQAATGTSVTRALTVRPPAKH